MPHCIHSCSSANYGTSMIRTTRFSCAPYPDTQYPSFRSFCKYTIPPSCLTSLKVVRRHRIQAGWREAWQSGGFGKDHMYYYRYIIAIGIIFVHNSRGRARSEYNLLIKSSVRLCCWNESDFSCISEKRRLGLNLEMGCGLAKIFGSLEIDEYVIASFSPFFSSTLRPTSQLQIPYSWCNCSQYSVFFLSSQRVCHIVKIRVNVQGVIQGGNSRERITL